METAMRFPDNKVISFAANTLSIRSQISSIDKPAGCRCKLAHFVSVLRLTTRIYPETGMRKLFGTVQFMS